MAQDRILALTDQVVASLNAILDAIKVVRKEGSEKLNPIIITQALPDSKYSLTNFSCYFFFEIIRLLLNLL